MEVRHENFAHPFADPGAAEADPLANSPENPNAARPIVIVRMGTDDGIEGIAVTFYGGAMTRSLKSRRRRPRRADDRRRPAAPRGDHRQIARRRGRVGPGGMFTLALAAIDIALWDIRGKALGQPLWKLLGGARQRVADLCERLAAPQPVARRSRDRGREAQGKGLPRSQDAARLARPDDPPAKEVERARAVREALGPDIKLMCDINQRWRAEEAIDIGRRVEDAGVGLFWLEDVTTHDDYAGIAGSTRPWRRRSAAASWSTASSRSAI